MRLPFNPRQPLVWFILAFLGVCAAADASAQDAASVWQKVSQPSFAVGKALTAKNIALARDRIRITLADGVLQFTEPVEGAVFGAAFRGKGRVELQPPNALEAHQLRLFAEQGSLAMDFTEAAFVFSDGTFDEITRSGAADAPADPALGELYVKRQNEREDVGAELLPRLVKSLLSADRKRTALFAADLKTSEKGWIHLRCDALKPEEILVGRWSNWGGARLLDTWLSFPAANRSSAEAFRDPLDKEDFFIRGYKIDVTVTGGAELQATARVTVQHRVGGERLLLFEFDSNLRIESVKSQDGAALPFFQPRDPKDDPSHGDYVAVALPAPSQAAQAQTLEFRYAGKRVVRREGAGTFFCQSSGWYPTRPENFATRADFELNFRSPKKYTLVATGNKVDSTTDGEWAISTWKSEIPLAVAGFAFGDYKVQVEKVGNIDVEIYANRQPDDFMASIQMAASAPDSGVAVGQLTPAALTKTMATELSNTLRVFERFFGPYPYTRLALTNIPYSYGQGWPTLIYLSALSFLDSTQRNAFGIKEHTELTDFFRAHESSHQWWGHRVGWKSYHDQWLSEGFAQFSGNLYVEFRQNVKEHLLRIRKDREDLLSRDQKNRVYESLGPVWMGLRLASSDAPGAYSNVIYNKGGLILNTLRRLMFDPRSQNPDERFIAMMQDFCQTHHNQAASTEDFKAVAEKHMTRAMDLEGNGKLDWFFRQYVYGTGIPQYQLYYQADPTGDGKYKVSGKVVQSGVPAGWKDALAIYLQHSGGKVTRVGILSAAQPNTPFEFILPMKPEKLMLNHMEDTIAEIK